MRLVKLKPVNELQKIFFENRLSNPVEKSINLADKIATVINDYSNILIIKIDNDNFYTITSDCIEYELSKVNADIADLGQNAVPHNNS